VRGGIGGRRGVALKCWGQPGWGGTEGVGSDVARRPVGGERRRSARRWEAQRLAIGGGQ
jgi:hypothetical protein